MLSVSFVRLQPHLPSNAIIFNNVSMAEVFNSVWLQTCTCTISDIH